jgi:GT2 family glycosyltransferase
VGKILPTDDTLSLSIVIPTSRGEADLDACLRSLRPQRDAFEEVILVDNGSPRGLVSNEWERLPVRVIRNDENRGFAVACNQGIEASVGDLVLLLNDDTILEPGALHTLVHALADRPAWGACQPKLLLMDDPARLDTAGSFLTATGFLVHRGYHAPETDLGRSDEIFAAKGAALLLRRRALTETGGFDPRFFAYFEETDLCWRMWLAGWQVGFAADARVRHELGATASALPSDFVQFHSFKNRICTLIKNLGAVRLAWMLPYHLALCVALAVWYALRRRFALALAILRAIGWNLTHLRGTLRERRRIQSSRRLPDSALTPLIMKPTPLRELFGYARVTGP